LMFTSLFLSVSPSLRTVFFFTAPTPTASSTLSLHDALPISPRIAAGEAGTASESARGRRRHAADREVAGTGIDSRGPARQSRGRSEEHTSELQSPYDLVCRLLLEKKNTRT